MKTVVLHSRIVLVVCAGLLALALAGAGTRSATAAPAPPLTIPAPGVEPASAAAFPGANGKIVFASNRDGNYEIYVMDADGSNQTRLTNNAVKEEYPVWSPDGAKIAFVRGGKHFYYMNADGSGETHIISVAVTAGPPLAWSSDGAKIAFAGAFSFADLPSRSFDIYTINLDGSNVTALTSTADQDFSPNWSPDGAKIVFTRGDKIYVMNADGSGVTQLTPQYQNISPNWSPDGSKIVHNVDTFPDDGTRTYDIQVMNADGSNPNKVLARPRIDDAGPVWSPDGSKIAFSSDQDSNFEIYVMNPDGSNQTRLTNNPSTDRFPDWQPLQAGTINIVNAASPADNTVFNFTDTIVAPNSFTLQNPGTITKTFATVPMGTYTVTEQALNGWTLHDITCDDANSSGDKNTGAATIRLEGGETVTCTFDNIENDTIIVNKFAVGGDGVFPFTSTIPGNTAFNLTTTDGFTATLFGGLPPGAYAISETVPSGWKLLEADPLCSNGDRASAIMLSTGEVAVCNFFNLAENTIVVRKQTIGGDGAFQFTGDLGAFALTTKGQTANQVFGGLTPGGVYGITETVPAGWAQTGATCDNGDAPGNVTLGAGDHVTCVFTNTKQANLTIVKLTDIEDGTFGFTGNIPAHPSFTLTTTNGAASQNFADLPPGTYTVTETAKSGWSLGSATCNDGSNPAAIDLAPGEAVSCTFSNSRDVFALSVTTTGSGSGLVASTPAGIGCAVGSTCTLSASSGAVITLTATAATGTTFQGWSGSGCSGVGPCVVTMDAAKNVTGAFTALGTVVIRKTTAPAGGSGFAFSGDLGAFTLKDRGKQVVSGLPPGTYTVREDDPNATGFALSGLVCTDSLASGQASSGDAATRTATIRLDPGETVTCSFTNSQPNTISIEKVTIPDSTDSFAFNGGALGSFNVTAGSAHIIANAAAGSYTVTEADPAPAGYRLTKASCTDSATGQTTQGNLTTRSVTMTMTVGARIHCTFENTKLGMVVIRKASAPSGGSGFSFNGSFGAFVLKDGSKEVVRNVAPGSYTVTEDDPSGLGYQLSGLACTDSNPTGQPSSGNVATRTVTINVDPGETVACSFTNAQDDIITVDALTVPDSTASFSFDGGALGAFSVTVGQPHVVPGVTPGSYTITQADPSAAGYTLSRISCTDSATGQTFSGNLTTRSVSLTMTPGERVSCTFENTTQAPRDLYFPIVAKQ